MYLTMSVCDSYTVSVFHNLPIFKNMFIGYFVKCLTVWVCTLMFSHNYTEVMWEIWGRILGLNFLDLFVHVYGMCVMCMCVQAWLCQSVHVTVRGPSQVSVLTFQLVWHRSLCRYHCVHTLAGLQASVTVPISLQSSGISDVCSYISSVHSRSLGLHSKCFSNRAISPQNGIGST